MDNTIRQRAMEIRQFNRFYTNIIGLVNQTILASAYSLAEVRVMLELLLAGTSTAADLTKLLQIDAGYLSRMVRRFKKEKLLTADKSPTDGRAHILALTEKGRGIISGLSEASTRQIVAILEQLPEAKQRQLVSHMGAIRALLTRQADDEVVIRSQRPGDAGYIAYRHGVLYEQEYGLDKIFERYVISGIAKFLDSGAEGNIWVAEAGGRIVGSIAIVGADRETAQLRWFIIEPEYRGTGLGRRLMTVALAYCRAKEFRRVFLWTFVGLEAARHLYSSFGFVPTEQVENDTWRNGLLEERWDLALGE